MSWIHGPRATFDLETTGVDVETARIVTASLLLLNPDGSVRRAGEWLADPGVEIPEAAAESLRSMRGRTGSQRSRWCGSWRGLSARYSLTGFR